MYALSAADAISPAIQRTKIFLFRPFKWGTFLKLCLVAMLTEGLGSNFNSSWSGHHRSSGGPPKVFGGFHPTPEVVAAVAAAVALAIVLCFVVSYLITRLRFAYFHCLIHNTKLIRPGWQLYRTQATRFFWLNVVVGICFLVVMVLIALPFLGGLWRMVRDSQAGVHVDIGWALTLILPLIPIIVLFVLACLAADLILRDLMLPHYALENATAGQAWAAVRGRIKREKGPFFLYAILRIVLPIVAGIALFIVMIIPAIIFIAATVGAEYVIHSVFVNAAGAAVVGAMVLEVLVGVIAFGIALLVGLCLGGPLSTGIREYALLFYGGRYQALGDILAAPPPSDAGLNAMGTA